MVDNTLPHEALEMPRGVPNFTVRQKAKIWLKEKHYPFYMIN